MTGFRRHKRHRVCPNISIKFVYALRRSAVSVAQGWRFLVFGSQLKILSTIKSAVLTVAVVFEARVLDIALGMIKVFSKASHDQVVAALRTYLL